MGDYAVSGFSALNTGRSFVTVTAVLGPPRLVLPSLPEHVAEIARGWTGHRRKNDTQRLFYRMQHGMALILVTDFLSGKKVPAAHIWTRSSTTRMPPTSQAINRFASNEIHLCFRRRGEVDCIDEAILGERIRTKKIMRRME